jgi:hypothetical protein
MSNSLNQNNNESQNEIKENEKKYPFHLSETLNSKEYYSQMQKLRITQ